MTTTQESASAAVAELLEIEQVRRLLFDYAFHLDMNHPDEIAALFTEDCYVSYGPDFGAEGRPAYRETLGGIGSFFAATSHHVSNIVVDFGPDLATAKVRSVLYAWHKYTKDRPDGHFFGQYHDELVKTADGWRFARRELRAAGVVDFHVKKQIPIGRS
ncbi:nuclear transport factor 2 family protein [Amycolatopsis saalfeldensis]|uniref:SnoaL-like domain-containing protein n=1 Tax=Amycolatopsis saalfeldensis TaxID=394193 RepID=A0A1H8U4F5_9PSEU|nr:nuclear transport factor 2 family protein [Amycolatopsis saalfeldensis]SEO98119.1 SnoaL-like domain-containing protein [Amycolatopsis saalfeldensis]